MLYRGIDFDQEIQDLKEHGVGAWGGKKQKYLTVSVYVDEGIENRKYYFPSKRDYTHFIDKLRRLE